MDLKTSLSQLSGIGPSLSYKLKKLNLETVEDLIYHFPFRYDDFSKSSTIKDAQLGQVVTLQGEIWSIANIYTRYGKVLTQAIFNDGTSPIQLTWFNQPYLTKQFKTGDRLQISGKLTQYKNKLSIMAPKWEKIEDRLQTLHTGRLVPIYPETEGLTSKWIRTKVSQIFPQVSNLIVDPLPESIKGEMLSSSESLSKIHFPQNYKDVEKSRDRLGFDELFFVALATKKARIEWSRKPLVKPLTIAENDLNRFIEELPFTLTSAQIRVLWEIISDLKKNQPMNRLIQGEVGSGKTVVAAIICYLVYKNNLRTLFMTPTEILAFQHYETLHNLLSPHGVTIGVYTGSRKFTKNQESRIKNKDPKKLNSLFLPLDSNPDVIIGTHALLSDTLNTKDTGLIIVDEQQRFGVEQRTFLRSKAKIPHFLTLTATPIPRTVALTLYGDLDLSIIDELPKDRQKIKTYVVPAKKRDDAYNFIKKKIKKGDQVYIITPLIDLSETLQSVRAATEEFERLQKIVFSQFKLALLHGRMSSKRKDEVMKSFREKKIDILVSTSVVEVGVDIPNATVMMIESSERFGLAQLHQLRGRVGRGSEQSYCLLFTDIETPQIVRRLKNLENIDDGLKLAELDLKIRGGGEVFGTKQSGRFEFKIASLSNLTLVEQTKNAAQKLLLTDPSLDKHPLIKAKLESLAANVMPD